MTMGKILRLSEALYTRKNFDTDTMMQSYYFYKVQTTYKSGRRRTDVIKSDSKQNMWEEYDKHHNKQLIKDSVIADYWLG